MAAITVYEHPLSPYAQKVKIALREKGIDFKLELPMAIGSGADIEEFARINPRSEVPLYVEKGEVEGDFSIFDSTIIVQYIEDKWPEPALLPKTPAARAKVRLIEEVMDTHYEAINWGLGEIHAFKRAEGAQADEITATAKAQTQSFYRWLEGQLDGADWFNGASFGYGDLCVVPFVNGSVTWGMGPEEGSAIAKWLDRVNRRPSVAQTREEALAMAGGLELAQQAIEQGLMKREYRDHRLEWMIKSGGLSVVVEGLEKDNIRFTGAFA
ncbi:MAG: glutathione S-transferase family protein [Alphaproteobacteria bacterium]